MTERRSILLVTDNLKLGGVQTVVVQLSRLMSNRGWKVGIVAATGELEGKLPANVERYVMPASSITPWRLRRIAMRGSYGIVHAHQRGVALAARIGLLGTSIPLVEHVHNTFLPVSRKRLSFRGDILIACGSSIATMLSRDYGRPAGHIRTVFNAVPDLAGTGNMPRQSSRIQILTIGRLTEQKDPMRALRVVEALERASPGKYFLKWAGGGPYEDEFLAEITARRLPVEWLGQVQNAQSLLESADWLLLTSKWEGLPLVLVEALSWGVPAVAPDVGSCSDAVANDVTGLLYSPNATATEIADLIMQRESRRAELGAAARARFESHFTESRFVEEIERAYESAQRNKAFTPHKPGGGSLRASFPSRWRSRIRHQDLGRSAGSSRSLG